MNQKPKKTTTNTKRKILEAALDCFSNKGYEGTTMDDVIAAAGVSKGSIYWHFNSKRELFIELLDYWWEGFLEQFEQLARSGGTAMQRIGKAIRMSLQLSVEDIHLLRAYMEFFNVGMKDPQFMERQLSFYERGFRMMTNVIEEGIAAGEFGIADARFHAEAINSYIDGLMMHLILDPDYYRNDVADKSEQFVKRALLYRGEKES